MERILHRTVGHVESREYFTTPWWRAVLKVHEIIVDSYRYSMRHDKPQVVFLVHTVKQKFCTDIFGILQNRRFGGGKFSVKPVFQVSVLVLHVYSIGCTENFGAFYFRQKLSAPKLPKIKHNRKFLLLQYMTNLKPHGSSNRGMFLSTEATNLEATRQGKLGNPAKFVEQKMANRQLCMIASWKHEQ